MTPKRKKAGPNVLKRFLWDIFTCSKPKNEIWKLNLDVKVSKFNWFIICLNPSWTLWIHCMIFRWAFCKMCQVVYNTRIIIINEALFLCLYYFTDVDRQAHLQLKLCCLFGVPIFLNSSVNWDGEEKGGKINPRLSCVHLHTTCSQSFKILTH